tara:strand:- start:392 stop:637 length:246 start_codon:yes stop_codon:yes gene_type:complete
MLKKFNIKYIIFGVILGAIMYILPIILLKPDNHIIAYIYDPDIIELYKQKKLKLKHKIEKGKKVKVSDINIKESINGMEII